MEFPSAIEECDSKITRFFSELVGLCQPVWECDSNLLQKGAGRQYCAKWARKTERSREKTRNSVARPTEKRSTNFERSPAPNQARGTNKL